MAKSQPVSMMDPEPADVKDMSKGIKEGKPYAEFIAAFCIHADHGIDSTADVAKAKVLQMLPGRYWQVDVVNDHNVFRQEQHNEHFATNNAELFLTTIPGYPGWWVTSDLSFTDDTIYFAWTKTIGTTPEGLHIPIWEQKGPMQTLAHSVCRELDGAEGHATD